MQITRHSELMQRTNQVGVDFLLTDLEMAFTFLHVAETNDSQEARARNFGRALEGYRTVVHFLPRVMPSPAERSQLQGRLDELRHRLRQVGYSCET